MSYAVKELFYTIQGEGAQAGRAAVFCRFAGCNLWSGRERDRDSAICQFCDTDFVGVDGPGGGTFPTAAKLADAIAQVWSPHHPGGVRPMVVFTGGEPLLQLDAPLIGEVHQRGFAIAVETNGTLPAPPGIDWLCVSPKAGTTLKTRGGNELKLVFPQPEAPPEAFAGLPFEHFFLQPMDGPQQEENMRLTVAYCLAHPQWRVSVQTHKVLRIP